MAPSSVPDAERPRPAFYALRTGGWRDYLTLLHPPYTAWHLSYVIVGGCIAPSVAWGRLGVTVLAFALALGVGAHALDELRGRPLQTKIRPAALIALAAASVAASSALGIAVAISFSLWLLLFVAVGVFLVLAYNLELFGGSFHTDAWFGLAWGAFPVLTGFWACAGTLHVEAVAAAGWATLLSLAQRRLSTSARHTRRDVVAVRGALELHDGSIEPIDRAHLVEAPEAALRLLTASTILLAATVVALRV